MAKVAAFCAVLCLLSIETTVVAQGDAQVGVSAVLVPEAGAGMREVATVSIGLRRGVANIDGVRFVHPADALSSPRMPDAVAAAVDDLDAIADLVRSGRGDAAEERAAAAIEAFEANLATVRRANLVDAYMLRALADCERRRIRDCRSGFQRVVTFREGADYNPQRYPPQHQALFEEVRDRLVAEGIRGGIEIITEPVGAEVFVDGRSWGPSPVLVEGLLVGSHYVTVKAVGYEKVIARADVHADYQETVEYLLDRNDRALMLERELPRIREEMGAPRAGRFIFGLRAYLFTNQVIVGVVRPAPGDRIDVTVYLYHLRTRHLLSERQAVIPVGEPGIAAAEQLALDLYEGVDLEGAIAPPDDDLVVGGAAPFWQQWWFWTAVGVVVVSGVAAIIFLNQREGAQVPEGWTRLTVDY